MDGIEQSTEKINPLLTVLLGVIGVSFAAVIFRYATAPVLAIIFYRIGGAALILAPKIFLRHRDELKRFPKRKIFLCALCGIFLALHFIAFYEGLKRTSVASATVLVNLEVFFVALFSYLLWKQTISKKLFLGIVIAFIGCVIVGLGDHGAASNALLGDVFCLIGCICGAAYTMIGSYIRKDLSTTPYTFMVYLASALALVVIAFFTATPLFGHGIVNLLVGLSQMVLCTLLGHSVYSWGLKYCKATAVSALKLMEPVFASTMAFIILHEAPQANQIIGGIIIIVGILWFIFFREKKIIVPPPENAA